MDIRIGLEYSGNAVSERISILHRSLVHLDNDFEWITTGDLHLPVTRIELGHLLHQHHDLRFRGIHCLMTAPNTLMRRLLSPADCVKGRELVKIDQIFGETPERALELRTRTR